MVALQANLGGANGRSEGTNGSEVARMAGKGRTQLKGGAHAWWGVYMPEGEHPRLGGGCSLEGGSTLEPRGA
jgi:hypothetical protein